MRTLPALLCSALLLAACSPQTANRGNLVEARRIEQVKVGESTQDDVRRILGSPTTIATFDENVWYYMGQMTEQTAFMAPETVQSQVLRLRFDGAGTLAALDKVDGLAAETVDPVAETTPSAGRQLTVFEQLMGNFGRGRLGAKTKDK